MYYVLKIDLTNGKVSLRKRKYSAKYVVKAELRDFSIDARIHEDVANEENIQKHVRYFKEMFKHPLQHLYETLTIDYNKFLKLIRELYYCEQCFNVNINITANKHLKIRYIAYRK